MVDRLDHRSHASASSAGSSGLPVCAVMRRFGAGLGTGWPPAACSGILSYMTRRQVLAAPLAAAAFSASAQPSPRFTKGICSIIFPREMPRPECFAQAKSAGFDAVELSIGSDFPLDISHDDARRMADAAGKAGIRIATLWISEALHQNPLNEIGRGH